MDTLYACREAANVGCCIVFVLKTDKPLAVNKLDDSRYVYDLKHLRKVSKDTDENE